MFSRLKGAIDSRIAEEQARQRQAQQAAANRQPQRRRPQNANSAARSPARQRDPAIAEKGPDPREFEPDFVVGDADSKATDPKGAGTAIEAGKTDAGGENGSPDGSLSGAIADKTLRETSETSTADASENNSLIEQPTELPSDVRLKLRKLEKLESKYGELLKAYRTAHGRVQAVERFEASLRENTPLTSISDPTALVEYLNQTKLKGDMVLDELKRVTADRDEYKRASEKSETSVSHLKTQIEELQKKVEQNKQDTTSRPAELESNSSAGLISSDVPPRDGSKLETSAKSPELRSARIPSLSMFSPKLGGKKQEPEQDSEDLFSYDSEVPRLEAELEQKTIEVEGLTQQLESLRNDLKVTRESTEGMMETLEERTKELNNVRDTNSSLESANSELKKKVAELEATAEATTKQVEDLQKHLDEMKNGKASVEAADQEIAKVRETWLAEKTDFQSQIEILKADADLVNEKLSQKDHLVKDLEDSLASAKNNERGKAQNDSSGEKKIKVMNNILDDVRSQLNTAQSTISDLKSELSKQQKDFATRPSNKVLSFLDQDASLELSKLQTKEDAVKYLTQTLTSQTMNGTESKSLQINMDDASAENSTASGNKKNKKKKKGGKRAQNDVTIEEHKGPVKVSEDLSGIQDSPIKPISGKLLNTSDLLQEVDRLKAELSDKVNEAEKLSNQLKEQDVLMEEIETLRDDLLHQGEEHVEARDALKKATQKVTELQSRVDKLKEELADARKQISDFNSSETAHKEARSQFVELQANFNAKEKDLKAAEQLAAARFKDISDLKELLTKAQPELRSLRNEVAELKSAKEDLKNKQGELGRLESRHEDLKVEMKGLSKRFGDKDTEIKTLQHKIEQESRARARIEDELTSTQSDLRVAENRRNEANERSEQTSRDFAKAKEDAASLRSKLREFEDQLSNHVKQIAGLKDEVSLKGTLHASSQTYIQSLRDQTHELSTQAREASARSESLEEELTEAQKMLSERTREGQTMRSLLNQAENESEGKIREMKETMESAIEERDRIEDEASVASRRMMREVEDAKVKAREAQRELKAAEDERDELETRSRSWHRMRTELEQVIESAKTEAEDMRVAMKGLREALDESERQIREAENHKGDLRQQGEEASERIEKLTRANKSLSEEIKALQSGAMRKGSFRPVPVAADSGLQSSRTSTDSNGARSPAPVQRANSRTGIPTINSANPGTVGLSQAPVDYVYLKNVLLQFLERKDKAHQRQLIPVLGMLLHFDRDEEQKWISAISAR